MDRLRQAHLDNLASPDAKIFFSEDEYQKLMQADTTRVREWRIESQLRISEMKQAEHDREDAADRLYTQKAITGSLTDTMLAKAGGPGGDLNPNTARALHNFMAQGDI